MSGASFIESQTWLVMNDGARLDASVLLPTGAGPEGGWPAVLLVHGHGDTGCKVSCLPRARRLVARGYAVVAYSVRGQGASEGLCFHMGPREIFDLQDVVAWMLHSCPVDPERLAVCGSSQGGWHAYMAAIHCPQVATVVPENIFTDYASFVVRDGCLNRWFFTRTMRRRIMTAGFQELARQWALAGEWDLLRAWMQERSPLNFAERIRCPVFIVHGWHDVGMPPNDVVEMFARLQVDRKLYLGAGGHDGIEDESARQMREDLVDRWLDHWLQGIDTGIMDEPPVTVACRPGWEHVSLPGIPQGQAEQVLHLCVEGRLQADAPTSPTLPSNINNFPLDPEYGLAQALRDDMAGVAAALAREEIVFDGDVLGDDLLILGAPVAELHILPNRADVQVHIELYDVDGKGGSVLICRGHHGTRTAAAGGHLLVAVTAATIHYRLSAGHRLRLVVTNYNTTFAFPFFSQSCTRLFHDDERPSHLTLPLA
ncbi:MAG: alpha/beta fold hydrolase [bacterium]|nr:alpha/beta fold hydrolase [bacterium]